MDTHIGRRRFLELGALGGAATLLAGCAGMSPASDNEPVNKAEALVLSCMDYRLVNATTRYMAGRGLADKYYQVMLAGASIAAGVPVRASGRPLRATRGAAASVARVRPHASGAHAPAVGVSVAALLVEVAHLPLVGAAAAHALVVAHRNPPACSLAFGGNDAPAVRVATAAAP